jgi:glyoxylase-like metal-dependent hydrolase (beta-lactamase superfamily II)
MESSKGLPDHLSGRSATGISIDHPIAQFELGPLRNFVYLAIDWQMRSAWIIDPQSDLSPLHEALRSHALKLEGILLTHSHHDHVAGVPALVQAFPGIRLVVGERDAQRLRPELRSRAQVTLLTTETEIALGARTIRALPTPGHSVGEICYFLGRFEDHAGRKHPPFLFTGDTVFIRDCGRTDFPDGSDEEMFASLQRIRALPPDTVILPGHHYQPECASTLARELLESPPFQCRSVEELAALP